MKTKIVLWAEKENDEKILLGIQLLSAENLIRIHVVPEKDATEIFYNQMMNQWREGQDIPMPDSLTIIDRPLSMTEGLLPDDFKTQRQDIVARAKTEWHFVVLSSKLYQAYADELAEIKERIDELSDFDGGIWEEMKAFWGKVQSQVREKNLFREHATELRAKTNGLFETLKSLKKALNDEFEQASKVHLDAYFEKLQNIEDRIEKGLGLQPIFNELKNLQNNFKNVSLTRKHHNDVWKRLDGAFKKIKEKKYGKPAPGTSSAQIRLTRRHEGLVAAIKKMEQSINRDIKDKEFQKKRINTTDGQLELQIRQAKMAIIEERVASKQTKLDDMLRTKVDLEKKIEAEKIKEEKRKAQQERKKDVKKAVESAKEGIAKEMEEKAESMKEDDAKLQKAAKEIQDSKRKEIPATSTGENENEISASGDGQKADQGSLIIKETEDLKVEPTETTTPVVEADIAAESSASETSEGEKEVEGADQTSLIIEETEGLKVEPTETTTPEVEADIAAESSASETSEGEKEVEGADQTSLIIEETEDLKVEPTETITSEIEADIASIGSSDSEEE